MDPRLDHAIAITGLAGRFPRARDADELWRNQCAGIAGIRALSDEELRRAGVAEALLSEPSYVKASADLDGIELFEPELFGLSPREAEAADPQQRLLLELAWEALEDAGRAPGGTGLAVGVFVGASRSGWLERVLADSRAAAALGDWALDIGASRDFLATRLAYALDLRGPCLTVQTACSTSLVAVHLAVQSLAAGECDLALAGGASVRLPQGVGYLHQSGGVTSPDGRCRPFEARARGTVAGNGAGIVALRRLADALREGDPVRAVILASAVNNDGSSKVGFTAPSARGQEAVVAEALELAGVDPATIGYVEAHGTATPLGDPIEVAALHEVFGAGLRPRSCALGSIKSSLGHLDAAAGVAGLIQALLAVERGLIPPSPWFERSNPALELERGPFFVSAALRPWTSSPRRAGVSSFGIGGTNAHVVLEEAPAPAPAPADRSPQVLVLSARTAASLERARERLAARLEEPDAPALADAAWTLQVGRRELARRAALVAGEPLEAARSLRAGKLHHGVVPPAPRPVAFLFPGQGAQRLHMGRGLRETTRVFREGLERCAALLRPHLSPDGSVDLLEVLHPSSGREQDHARRLDQTWLAQPALFAVEYALARTWIAWGVEPAALIGHSVGELAAACLAGVFELQDGLRLVAERGRAMQAMPAGSMLAVALGEEALRSRLAPPLEVASINGPALCVASGPTAAIEALERELAAEGTSCRRLRTSHAFHSASMEPAAERLREVARAVRLSPPRIPIASNTTGDWLTAEQATSPDYWAEQLRRPVRLGAGLRALIGRFDPSCVEVGPGRSLGPLVRGLRPSGLALSPLADGAAAERAALLDALGALWTQGACVDWEAVHGSPRRRVRLPTYAFERRRCWPFESPSSAPDERGAARIEALAPVPSDRLDGVARLVAETWSEVLGQPVRGPDEDFFELGGSSLLAIQVVARLQEHAGAALGVTDLLEAPTLAAFARRVEEARGAPTQSESTLVGLQPRGADPPWWLLHGIDGGVARLRELALALGAENPALALRAPGLESGEAPCERVEELAQGHLRVVRARQPRGPYRLVGYSFGGLAAFEMARALRDLGQEVELVALLDSRRTPEDAGELDERTALLALLAHLGASEGELERAEGLGDEDLRELALARLVPAGAAPSEGHRARAQRRLAVFRAHARAALRWRSGRPAPVDAPLAVFTARDERGAREAAEAWRTLAPALVVREIDGDHRTMIEGRGASDIARAVRELIGTEWSHPAERARLAAPLQELPG